MERAEKDQKGHTLQSQPWSEACWAVAQSTTSATAIQAWQLRNFLNILNHRKKWGPSLTVLPSTKLSPKLSLPCSPQDKRKQQATNCRKFSDDVPWQTSKLPKHLGWSVRTFGRRALLCEGIWSNLCRICSFVTFVTFVNPFKDFKALLCCFATIWRA